VSGLLELASQHMTRFHELEELEWKINFSVWALLGGLAYVWGASKLTPPTWIKSPLGFILIPLPVVLLHGAAVFMLNVQHRISAEMRNHYRDQADALLRVNPDLQPPHTKPYGRFLGLRWRDFYWNSWFMLVTFLLADAVLFLITVPRIVP
jgi:hypothetical protein